MTREIIDMDNQTADKYLEQYHNMVRKAAWGTSQAVGSEFDDALGEAYLIFCETLEKYDHRFGVKFGTYLTHRLRDLGRRVFRVWDHRTVPFDPISSGQGEILGVIPYNNDQDEFLYKIIMLDGDAKVILNGLLLGWFDINGNSRGGRHIPGFNTVYRTLADKDGWSWSRCRDAWSELKRWWNDE